MAAIVLVSLISLAEGSQAYVWNSLRPFENFSQSINTWTTIVILVLGAGLFFISLKAFEKHPTQQFLFLAIAFGIFSLKFLLEAIDIFYSPGHFLSPAAKNIFDFLVLVALFASLVKKG